ncbi:MAG TPA: hypothetical protein GXX36_09770 [Clostridiaceae bacterium]|nr:hypothetical protein [Clostridiaceae bacterium]
MFGEYIVSDPLQKKYQDNFLFNERFFSYVTHTGMGYSRYTDENDYTTNIIHGTIDNQQYEHSRMVYIRDNDTGEFWSVGWEPVCKPYEKYECRLGYNYTTITNLTVGVKCKWTILVPQGRDPVELWNVEIETDIPRNLSVYLYSELSLLTTIPTYGHDGYMSAAYNPLINGITVKKSAQALIDKLNSISVIPSRKPDYYTCSRFDFMGLYRTAANPLGLVEGKLPNSIASKERICAAFQYNCIVEGQFSVNQMIIGHHSGQDLTGAINKYSDFDKIFMDTVGSIKDRFRKLLIKTGDVSLDTITNTWNKQLILFGATHCRWGIKGFRDVVQHAQGVLYFDAELTRKSLLKSLQFQYSNGFAVRSYPVVYEDSKMHYSDSASWLLYAVSEYVKETGDTDFLKEEVSFLDGGKASVLKHMELIIHSLYQDRGEHGLVRIHDGDWNDSLTHVGREGRGESVWLSMFLAKGLLIYAELLEFLGQDARDYYSMYEKLKHDINENAWDGEWYIRAFNDKGGKLGSKENERGLIFLNTQSWAIISGVADQEKIDCILKSIKRYLYTDYGYLLNYPTYTSLDENVGRMSCMEPGTAENGSVYIHGNAFLIYALLGIGYSEDAYKILKSIQPDNPLLADKPVCPYIYGNCYYGPDHKKEAGKMEFSWITGSANWLLQSIVELMLGIRRTYEGLVIEPMLPEELKQVEVYREYRGCRYHIEIKNNGKNVKSITLNGVVQDPLKALPIMKNNETINRVQVEME